MSPRPTISSLVRIESHTDYKAKTPHKGWLVLSVFGPTPSTDVLTYWALQRDCAEGKIVEDFLAYYAGKVELALVPSEEVGLEYQGKPQPGKNVLVVRPVSAR